MTKGTAYTAIALLMCFQFIRGQQSWRFVDDTIRIDAVISENEQFIPDVKTYFHRDTATDNLEYGWELIYHQWQEEWTIFYCDPQVCNDPKATSGTFEMLDPHNAPIDSGLFKIGAMAGTTPGRADVEIRVWPIENPQKVLTLFYIANVTMETAVRYRANAITQKTLPGIASAAVTISGRSTAVSVADPKASQLVIKQHKKDVQGAAAILNKGVWHE